MDFAKSRYKALSKLKKGLFPTKQIGKNVRTHNVQISTCKIWDIQYLRSSVILGELWKSALIKSLIYPLLQSKMLKYQLYSITPPTFLLQCATRIYCCSTEVFDTSPGLPSNFAKMPLRQQLLFWIHLSCFRKSEVQNFEQTSKRSVLLFSVAVELSCLQGIAYKES